MITLERESSVAIITLNDPDKRNAMNSEMNVQIAEALDQIEASDQIHAVVITGAAPAFCAGAPLGHLADAAATDIEAGLRSAYKGFLRVAACPLPVIAAVNGVAVGAGMNLALCADLRITSPAARFDCRFLKLGIHPGGGHTWMLERLVGPQQAAAMVLFGERVNGERAVDIGLSHDCVEADRLVERAIEIGQQAAEAPRELLKRTTRTLREMTEINFHPTAVDKELSQQAWSMRQPEFAERLAALQQRISGG